MSESDKIPSMASIEKLSEKYRYLFRDVDSLSERARICIAIQDVQRDAIKEAQDRIASLEAEIAALRK